MKILTLIARILLGLLLVMPVLGSLGFLPAPTEELYTPEGWAFISALMATGYMMPLMGFFFAVCLVLVIMNRMALAAVLLAPITVNVMFFHWFLDATPIGPSSVMGYLLLILNAYFLWINREKYRKLW